MNPSSRSVPRNLLRCAGLLAWALAGAAALAQAPAAYPGTLQLEVDATDLDHRIFQVRQRLPVVPGPLTLYFPRWLPGQHAPNGDVSRLAGLVIKAGAQTLPWARDPADTHAFLLTVPPGVRELDLGFGHLSPVTPDSGRVVATRQMLNVQWQSLLLYPAGPPASGITVQASLRLPEGWSYGTALRAARSDGAQVQFAPVSLETLVDSPVFAGQHFKRFALDPEGAAQPVVLHLMADSAAALATTEAQIDAHRRLVQQADKLFGPRRFAHYDFLLALSDELGGIGLEHHQSSENGVNLKYFEAWDKGVGDRELLPHEYAHSWNGKFRRPADLSTRHFNEAMQNSLLWLYEGQTEYWGRVLAVRSGLVSAQLSRESLAQMIASLDSRAGRQWRNLQDTTNEPSISSRNDKRDWRDWQRTRGDYYVESVLIWLDADTLIRERSGGARSLDDFAAAFFNPPGSVGQAGQAGPAPHLGPLPYTFADVVVALNAVLPHDWAGFLRQRLDGHGPGAPLDGLARAGWRLAWRDTPTDDFKANEAHWKATDLSHSIGLYLAETGKLAGVRWDGPAFRAGLAPGMTLVAVNQIVYKADRLKAAISANRDGSAPIELLLRDGERFKTVRIDWRGGQLYPLLERIDASEDRLSTLMAPR